VVGGVAGLRQLALGALNRTPGKIAVSDLRRMGKDPSARFKFIMERAEEAEELDV
jgi:hypothetical protein